MACSTCLSPATLVLAGFNLAAMPIPPGPEDLALIGYVFCDRCGEVVTLIGGVLTPLEKQ